MTEHYVIIIGTMKSGTTTLFDMLAQHPAIAPAHPKEPGFFAFDEIYARGFEWYNSLFDFDPARHVYRLEASTDYTKAPFVTGVWDRMHAQPSARYKLICILRHPLRRIESHARHVQRTRKEIGQQVSLRLDHGLDVGPSLVSLSISNYARQLDVYAAVQAAGDLHVVILEELTADPDWVMAKIWEFLGLPPIGIEEAGPLHSNAGRGRTELSPSIARLIGLRSVRILSHALLHTKTRAWLKERFRREVRLSGRFQLSAAEEIALSELYASDIARLAALYNVDVARIWGLSPELGSDVVSYPLSTAPEEPATRAP